MQPGGRPLQEGLEQALARARLVAMDVDGVLTDGSVLHSETGELQRFSVRDGLGIRLLLREGLAVAWISGRGCAATRSRAAELGVVELHLGVKAKGQVLTGIQERLGIGTEETIAMGDDLPDLALAAAARLLVAPADAHAEVRARAQLVCAAGGGRGAVRELAEVVLRARGSWPQVVGSHGA